VLSVGGFGWVVVSVAGTGGDMTGVGVNQGTMELGPTTPDLV